MYLKLISAFAPESGCNWKPIRAPTQAAYTGCDYSRGLGESRARCLSAAVVFPSPLPTHGVAHTFPIPSDHDLSNRIPAHQPSAITSTRKLKRLVLQKDTTSWSRACGCLAQPKELYSGGEPAGPTAAAQGYSVASCDGMLALKQDRIYKIYRQDSRVPTSTSQTLSSRRRVPKVYRPAMLQPKRSPPIPQKQCAQL